jgi:hypothetical protein
MKVDPGETSGGERGQPVATPEVPVTQRGACRAREDQRVIVRKGEAREVP